MHLIFAHIDEILDFFLDVRNELKLHLVSEVKKTLVFVRFEFLLLSH